jgi:hypothetical protein
MPGGYLTNTTATAQAYVDPADATNNLPAVNNITVAWNAGDSFEKNLQRVITQKWLAIYPDGQEAWTDLRRTGYPKVFPVKVNHSGGTITTAGGVKRLPYTTNENATNPKGVASGVAALGGPDNGGTRLWWDKNPNVPN